jgi:cytochrome d ubiquinol oxidase subunit II
MQLHDVPLIFALIGLVLYTVLAGADYGAGIWQLTAGRGPEAKRLRDHAHNAMAAVWEANHVWLIFVITVVWTAYPTAFGSIASTLGFPLFIAAIGIIVRGAAYALRTGTSTSRELRVIDSVSALSSILTPFALGAAVGGIASQRVPVGNAAGDLFSSWLNPTSITIGLLAVVTSAYLAAVFLAGDAVRAGRPDLERRFRARALWSGVVAGAIALAGLAVLHSDAHHLYHRLVSTAGLGGVILSMLGGLTTLALVWRGRYEAARYTAPVAVGSIIAGWALAQAPTFLPGLTVRQAAASDDVLVAVTVAVLAGAAVLFPSLALLFRLVLRGRLDHGDYRQEASRPARDLIASSRSGLLPRLALGCLLAGFGLLTVAQAGWAHAVGIVSLFAFIAIGFFAAVLPELSASSEADR